MPKTSWKLLVTLAITVVIWYLALAYLPQVVGTCFDGVCGFSAVEVILSFAVPLVLVMLTVILEMLIYRKGIVRAFSDIGLTRFDGTGIRVAAGYLLPLLLFFPLIALLTHTPLALQPNWQWLLLSALFINGLAEETMMRGFVFRHLRENRSFWRAAALSTVYFAAYHLMLIFTAGPVIGVIAVVTAIPASLLTAYIYERGSNTVWGPALFHALYNAPAFVFAFTPDVQPIASLLYLIVGIVVSTLMLVRAYWARYGRAKSQRSDGTVEATSLTIPLTR